MGRHIAWFSCGAASAVAAKLAVNSYEQVEVVYCNTMASEHEDNKRFFDEVQEWLQRPITVISSTKYATIDDVFMETRYMAGPQGARCTIEMKKLPRFAFQRPDDVHIFGFTVDEWKRIQKFKTNNPELHLAWPLASAVMTKEDCFNVLKKANINLPAMYQLGFRNNNCIGCVKASSARYWNMVRREFPDIFAKRAEQSRILGARLTRYKGRRIFLDELPPDYMDGTLENVSCGPECNNG